MFTGSPIPVFLLQKSASSTTTGGTQWGQSKLSTSWVGQTRFQILMPTPGVGKMRVLGQKYQKRTSSRPEIALPEVWEAANESARRKMAADFAPNGRPRAERRRQRQRAHVPDSEKPEYE